MARRPPTRTPATPESYDERIVDVDVSSEMRGSFLEYAYSVIYSRALPDARDGLKPVHRRILFTMAEMGLRPDRGHVKCARVVGDVMGKLHPHGDGAIYDALVRMAQPFAMRVPLVDGHGNFGSPDDLPAAMRYTECRLAPAALLLTTSLDEDVVDHVPSYDGQQQQPSVLPAAFPNLLVNGASGIAVGMATNMAPHNLGEVVAAARHLVEHPDATLEDLLRLVPGPDLPTGGRIVGLDGVREAYATGRGSFRTRATTRVESITARRRAIVVTELPYGVGPERVRERVAELVRARKLAGVADIEDHSDGKSGLRLVIEVKGGFVPEAVLEELFRLTPLEENFAVNNVALVDGQPRTLGLKELLEVYLAHRYDVVLRRTRHRRRRREERLHLVDGLLVALLDIDEVIQLIRGSETPGAAKERLQQVFDLSEVQAQYVLDTPLRRLTRYDRLELEREGGRLRSEIGELTAVVDSPVLLRRLVSTELAEVAAAHATPRRTVLLESAGQPAGPTAGPLEVVDEPCRVLLSTTGLLARSTAAPSDGSAPRASHDAVVTSAAATTRGDVGVVTSRGRVLRLQVVDLPALPPASAPTLAGGASVAEFVDLATGERVVGLTSLLPVAAIGAGGADGGKGDADGDPGGGGGLGGGGLGGGGLALATRRGVVKRVSADVPGVGRDAWDVVRLDDGDEVVAALDLASEAADLVLVTSDAQLLRFPAGAVRPQGRAAGGMAGVRLDRGASVVWFGAVDPPGADAVVVTVAGSSGALAGTQAGTAKVTPYVDYPAKGRGTGGVRCHRFLRGEDVLLLAWAGRAPARGVSGSGTPVELPPATGRRDGSGTPLAQPLAAVGRPA